MYHQTGCCRSPSILGSSSVAEALQYHPGKVIRHVVFASSLGLWGVVGAAWTVMYYPGYPQESHFVPVVSVPALLRPVVCGH